MPSDQPTLTSARTARKVQRRWPVIAASSSLVLVVLFGALIVVREADGPFHLDAEWMDEIVEHRSPAWEVPALIMNVIGGGLLGALLIPVLVTLTLVLFRRYWGAMYFAAASALSAALVQVLKTAFGRARPPDMLVSSDYGSFPSGHVANAATIATVCVVLFPFVAVWISGAAYTVVMALSRTYLGAHWITDTIGGAVLGIGVAVIVWAPLAARLHAEAERPHPFVLAHRTASKPPEGTYSEAGIDRVDPNS